MMRNVKQACVWLKRFRYRCGYGVHSPFAFDFITNVIYEKEYYYGYKKIEDGNRNKVQIEKLPRAAKRVNRMLLRLVNYIQPLVILDAGNDAVSSEYLMAGKPSAEYLPVVSPDEALPRLHTTSFFLYINRPEEPDFIHHIIENYMNSADRASMMVIGGIYQSTPMKSLWKQLVGDERVGITFDLYDVGILFFDKTKIKQHYTVNF